MPDVTITLATLISVVSVSFAIFFGIKSKKRADDEDVTKRAETITRLSDKMVVTVVVGNTLKDAMRQ